MKNISKMKTLLISITAVAGIVGASTASASLARVDYTGIINSYTDNTGTGTYSSALNQTATGSYLIDSVGTDRNPLSAYGKYKLSTPGAASLSFGSFSFSSDMAKVKIFNDVDFGGGAVYDGYKAVSMVETANQYILFGLKLIDYDANQFSSDSFVSEPVLSEFEGNSFYVRGFDKDTLAVNFNLSGTLTSLIDPPVNGGDVAPVPVPAPLLLLGSALAALGFGTRKRSKAIAAA